MKYSKKIYACPKCLEVIATEKLPAKIDRDNYLCAQCNNRSRIQIFDSKPEHSWFKHIYYSKIWKGEIVSRVVHHERYNFFDAVYYDPKTKQVYQGKKRKKDDILRARSMSYTTDITVETAGPIGKFVYDAKGKWMKPADRRRFERNCELMMKIHGIKVEVLK